MPRRTDHLAAGLAHVAGDYMGEHWLATFAAAGGWRLKLKARNDPLVFTRAAETITLMPASAIATPARSQVVGRILSRSTTT